MTEINILFDNQVFATQTYGGVSRLFYQLIKNLVNNENVKTFLFHGFYINHFPLADLKEKLSYYFGKKIPRLPHTAKFIRVSNTFLFNRFKPRKKIDLFHPTDFSPAVWQWKQKPLVLTVYDMIPELFPYCFTDFKQRLEIRKRCIQRADGIITISKSTKNDLLKFYGVDEKKVTVVYPGAPAPVENGEENNVNNHKPKKPFILYVGTRKQEYKNFTNLLQAYTAVQTVNRRFDLVCFGGTPFTPEESAFISRSGCEGRVVRVSGDDSMLARFYADARAFVYPSLYEGFGLPPLEAMAYGCPVAAAETSSIPEVLGDAALYFDPHAPDAIASSLETILFDNDTAGKLVKKGTRQVEKYSWPKMAEETYGVYKEILG
ncbi:MAG: glycosyltransferase family 4 protein [bacterium]|nr:glycosyltransferase family 4 protein [bacterium]